MAATEQEIVTRAAATHAVMVTIQNDWTWDEISVADFGALLAQRVTAQHDENLKKTAYDAQRGVVSSLFDDLENRKVQGLGMAAGRYRHDTQLLPIIEGVGEYGDSREMILKEADEWVAAWEELKTTDPVSGEGDAQWNPTASNNRPAFLTLLANCRTALPVLTQKRTTWQRAAKAHNAILARFEDLCVAWYDAATRAFKEGTEQGDLIRGQIPTFDAGGSQPPPANPQPAPNP